MGQKVTFAMVADFIVECLDFESVSMTTVRAICNANYLTYHVAKERGAMDSVLTNSQLVDLVVDFVFNLHACGFYDAAPRHIVHVDFTYAGCDRQRKQMTLSAVAKYARAHHSSVISS